MPPPEQPPASPFASLGLCDALVSATVDRGYVEPTPIQVGVIPSVLDGGDVWASAPTGSGKTASFVLPILERLGSRTASEGRGPFVLILVPTRELAKQTGENIREYGRHLSSKIVTRVVFGGVSVNPQMMGLRGGADIVVATPGRLLDLLERNALSLSQVSTLVLDEADRLLERSFGDELDRLFALIPERRQSLLFSATFPQRVRALVAAVLDSPTRVNVLPETSDEPAIHQRAIEVDKSKRTQLLRHLLETLPGPRVLVFVATKYATGHVSRKLRDLGIPAAAMHGKLSQGARTAALDDFRRGEVRVLVATDLAGRGLDIEGLSMVVNYDLPRSPTDYLHRIGRTGRAGASGVAVSFVTAEERAHFRLIERRYQLRLTREHIPGFEPVDIEVSETHTFGTGGIKGKRKSKKDKLREAAARASKDESS